MMKIYDSVKLKEMKKEYLDLHLDLASSAFVLAILEDSAEVVFFSGYNLGDFAIVLVPFCDLEVVDGKHSEDFLKFAKHHGKNLLAQKHKHKSLCPLRFMNVDYVEVCVSKKEYEKFGIVKGTRGFVAVDNSVRGKVLVDFSDAGVQLPEDSMGLFEVALADLVLVQK